MSSLPADHRRAGNYWLRADFEIYTTTGVCHLGCYRAVCGSCIRRVLSQGCAASLGPGGRIRDGEHGCSASGWDRVGGGFAGCARILERPTRPERSASHDDLDHDHYDDNNYYHDHHSAPNDDDYLIDHHYDYGARPGEGADAARAGLGLGFRLLRS